MLRLEIFSIKSLPVLEELCNFLVVAKVYVYAFTDLTKVSKEISCSLFFRYYNCRRCPFWVTFPFQYPRLFQLVHFFPKDILVEMRNWASSAVIRCNTWLQFKLDWACLPIAKCAIKKLLKFLQQLSWDLSGCVRWAQFSSVAFGRSVS